MKENPIPRVTEGMGEFLKWSFDGSWSFGCWGVGVAFQGSFWSVLPKKVKGQETAATK